MAEGNPLLTKTLSFVSTTPQCFLENVGKNSAYVKVRVVCPNCSRVSRGRKIKSDEVHEAKNVKCQGCHVTGFDWTYIPPRVGDAYVRINTSASISAADWPKVLIDNEKRFHLSNY